MIADFHNDFLTSENCEKVFAEYKKNKNIIVCALFKGERSEKKLLSLARFFDENKSENLYLSFEDFSVKDEKIANELLSFSPVAVTLTWNNANFLAGGAKSDGELTDCGKKLIKSVSGISESFREMTELVEMCNELELELCQLDDIIEDYLTDFTL